MRDHESVAGHLGDPSFQFKRFIVFYFEQYYPGGGLDDAVATFETFEECDAWRAQQKDYYHCPVFDCDARRYVAP